MSILRNAHDAMSNLVVEGHNCGPKQPGCMADGGGGGQGIGVAALLDYRKSTLARGSRWDYKPLPF